MKRIYLLAMVLLVALAAPAGAHDDQSDGKFGLSNQKILSMSPEDWAEYSNKKRPGGEAGYDEAYRVYAKCLMERSLPRLHRLDNHVQARIRDYRQLCAKFRVDHLSLEEAYAGGGTMYGHVAERGVVFDEQLVETLIKRYSNLVGPAGPKNWRATIDRIRANIRKQNPAVSANRKKLQEFDMVDQAQTTYGDTLKDLAGIEELLSSERPDIRKPILTYLTEQGR
jgi:hypothetical protein